MRVFFGDHEIRPGRPKTERKPQRPQQGQDFISGDIAGATVWLVFYLLAVVSTIVTPIVSRAIEIALR